MKYKILASALLFFLLIEGKAQKLDSILSRSSLSFSYGLSHDFFAKNADSGDKFDFGSRDVWGQIFGFDYSYRPTDKKNEWGFGFAKQVHRREYNQDAVFPGTIVRFEKSVLRNFKSFHYIHWKRHLIEDKLLSTVGLYYHRYRDQLVDFYRDFDENFVVNIYESTRFIDFGIFVGAEYYHDIRNFRVGIRTRLYYTQGYSESFESFEFTPVIKFKL